MIQLWLDRWRRVSLGRRTIPSEAVRPVHTQVDHDVHVERGGVAGSARAEEVVDARVGRLDLVEVRSRRGKIGQVDGVGIRA